MLLPLISIIIMIFICHILSCSKKEDTSIIVIDEEVNRSNASNRSVRPQLNSHQRIYILPDPDPVFELQRNDSETSPIQRLGTVKTFKRILKEWRRQATLKNSTKDMA